MMYLLNTPLPSLFAALGVFLSLFVTDVCWAIYVKHTQEDNAKLSAAWAVGLLATGAIGNIGYNANWWLLIPACIGAGLGTYTGVSWNKRKGA